MSHPEKKCGNCSLFHPDTTSGGLEANQTLVMIQRINPSNNQTPISYGKMGCYDNSAPGTLSTNKCEMPDKFNPLPDSISTA